MGLADRYQHDSCEWQTGAAALPTSLPAIIAEADEASASQLGPYELRYTFETGQWAAKSPELGAYKLFAQSARDSDHDNRNSNRC
jgi:hypothetical protein